MKWSPLETVLWSPEEWGALDSKMRHSVQRARTESESWLILARYARKVLKNYSTSFFLVTRFLPSVKRRMVECVYAAVRYPDEIVDTFAWSEEQKTAALNAWGSAYEASMNYGDIRQAMDDGVPCFVAAFSYVQRVCNIPPEHYRSFLAAMRMDISPRPFVDLDDLITNYVYGSAVVVGFFLAHIYGPRTPEDFPRIMNAANDLGIALQLTNFLRDVREDYRKGRLYLPLDILRAHGATDMNPMDMNQRSAFGQTIKQMAGIAEAYYASAERNLDAFAADSLPAIRACLDVYRELNDRIEADAERFEQRKSVPMLTKFRVLPPSKYWRVPFAYLS